jgi:hypothetical protein
MPGASPAGTSGSPDKWLIALLWLVIGLLVVALAVTFSGPANSSHKSLLAPVLTPLAVALLTVTIAIAWRQANLRRRRWAPGSSD